MPVGQAAQSPDSLTACRPILLGCLKDFVYLCGVKWLKQILSRFGSMRARVALAIVCGVVMLYLTWASDRSPYSIGSEDVLMRHLYLAEKIVGIEDRRLPADYLAVNVGYDRQLAPLCDEYGDTLGEREVANRYRMYRFLDAIKDLNYKAVLVDVFFDGDRPVPGDTALIELINGMRDVTVPWHASHRLSPLVHPERVSSGDYTVNIYEDDFVKYLYVDGSGRESVALRTYASACDDGKTPHGFLHQKTLTLPLDITMREQVHTDGTMEWYNLGSDLLSDGAEETLPRLVDGRIVVIGDYVELDRHGTYVGELSGPAIHINAIDALRRGLDKLNVLEGAVMYVAYVCICLILLCGMTIWRRFRVRQGSLLEYLLNFVSFSLYLCLLEIILYICFGKFHDAFLVTVFLSVFTLFCQQLNKQYPLCQE